MGVEELEHAGLDFDWAAPGALGENYIPRLLQIQRHEPLYWSNHQSAWIVTRHADIVAGLKDPRLSNRRYHLELEHHVNEGLATSGAMLQTVRRWLFNQDGREHMRLRTLLMKPFSKSQADSYRGAVRKILARRLDELETRESFDFAGEFAAPFVAEALLHIIGFTGVLSPDRMISMANAIVAALVTAGDAASVRAADDAIDALTPLIEKEIDERRTRPREDLLSNLVHLSEGGERLTIEDVISLFHVLMLAAIDTTANTLSLMMPVLDADGARRDYVRSHGDRMTEIVEELQRFVGMQNMMHRIAGESFEWHGKLIKQGQMIFFMLGAGNFDPNVFDQPDQLDFKREKKQQLTFAPGLHHCIGVHIAKMELEEALRELFNRYARVRVLETPEYQPNYMTRCFTSLLTRLER